MTSGGDGGRQMVADMPAWNLRQGFRGQHRQAQAKESEEIIEVAEFSWTIRIVGTGLVVKLLEWR